MKWKKSFNDISVHDFLLQILFFDELGVSYFELVRFQTKMLIDCQNTRFLKMREIVNFILAFSILQTRHLVYMLLLGPRLVLDIGL